MLTGEKLPLASKTENGMKCHENGVMCSIGLGLGLVILFAACSV